LSFIVAVAFYRFAVPIEKRYLHCQVLDWLAGYGVDVSFTDNEPYRIALPKRSHATGRSAE
jgi:hypothetical protein